MQRMPLVIAYIHISLINVIQCCVLLYWGILNTADTVWNNTYFLHQSNSLTRATSTFRHNSSSTLCHNRDGLTPSENIHRVRNLPVPDNMFCIGRTVESGANHGRNSAVSQVGEILKGLGKISCKNCSQFITTMLKLGWWGRNLVGFLSHSAMESCASCVLLFSWSKPSEIFLARIALALASKASL